MPEIKLKHVVSFSSEDKVHKSENLLNPETYRKWKCATPGEKNASVILQFEKATKIHSIDIGNESSAFVEVLVGRSSDSVNDYKVLLVASSFMSPIESRNEQHSNRVRMFGPEKLAQNLKEEKWDCVQVVCTQPFNKNITYGLSFIKFLSPPEKIAERPVEPESKTTTAKLGAFKIKYNDDEEEDSPPVGSWLERKNKVINSSLKKTDKDSQSYAAMVLSSNDSSKTTSQNPVKRKYIDSDLEKPAKKESPSVRVNKAKVGYRDILGSKNSEESNSNQSKKEKFGPKDIFGLNTSYSNSPTTSRKPVSKMIEASKALTKDRTNSKPPFKELMKGVVFVISGLVNPLRSAIRDKALEMGA
uniref:DNA repair protein XRCC1 n=1 Tax=Parasteatoda tepidariorum TaxID=114398 RepID=A0A2L2YD80_PARTP